MTRLTDDELAELERLEKAATPGPWSEYGRPQPTYAVEIDLAPADEEGTSTPVLKFCYFGQVDNGFADAEFVVAVRNALPSLLAELRELRAFKARVEGYRKRLADAIMEEYCDNNGYPSHVHELVDGIMDGQFNFDAAIFGEPGGGE